MAVFVSSIPPLSQVQPSGTEVPVVPAGHGTGAQSWSMLYGPAFIAGTAPGATLHALVATVPVCPTLHERLTSNHGMVASLSPLKSTDSTPDVGRLQVMAFLFVKHFASLHDLNSIVAWSGSPSCVYIVNVAGSMWKGRG